VIRKNLASDTAQQELAQGFIKDIKLN
jgi:hypothetical protein